MKAWPKEACWRLGSDLPAAMGLCTRSSVFDACRTLGVAQTSTMSSAARQTRPTRIDHDGATSAIAEAAARHASATSAVPAAPRTRPPASQAASQSPTAAGGHSHHRGLPRKTP